MASAKLAAASRQRHCVTHVLNLFCHLCIEPGPT
jgi:hypothetical protein